MAKNPEYAEGDVIANKYVVEKLFGESPSSRLYLANGNFDSQKLAVKIYRPDVSSILVSASDFFLKAGVMTEVEHDNLAATLDVQTEMDLVFVARPFVEGKSFESWLKNSDSETHYFSRGLEVLWQICQGLSTLHERSHHLNIHPGNIIVGPLVAKLCDWDPRALGSMEMTPEPLPAKPDYMGYRAPEMLSRGAFLSYPSTDLYAIAGLLYRLIKGQNPSANPAQTLGDTRSFDKDLAVFFGKALHPKPEQRFQDASAFSDALWELKPAMERLQQQQSQQQPRQQQRQLHSQVETPDPFTMPEQNTSTESKPAGSGDTFFNFFPAVEPSAPAQLKPSAKVNPDTEFGAPPIAEVKTPQPIFTQRPTQSAPPPPPTPPPLYNPPRSGMDSLESSSGTLFGSQAPLFGSQNKPAPRTEPFAPSASSIPIKPIVAKPMAVSLSSLENDPLERADGNMTAGFTQFGFKDAGENRTGIYNPEGKAIAAKAKLTLLFTILGVVVVVISLGALFVVLRSHAAAKDAMQAANKLPDPKPDPAETGEPFSDVQPTAVAATPAPATTAPPYPDAVTNSEPIAENKPVAAITQKAAPVATKAAPLDNTPPEPFPVQEPPDPQAQAKQQSNVRAVQPTQTSASTQSSAPTKSPAQSSPVSSNTKVTPERQAALMAIIQNRTWPASASERLRMADDFNDMGKIAEANMAYAKTMSAADITNKQKISALGGLAVTFQSMGMKDQALESVDKLLQINPNNSFAQKMKAKLK